MGPILVPLISMGANPAGGNVDNDSPKTEGAWYTAEEVTNVDDCAAIVAVHWREPPEPAAMVQVIRVPSTITEHVDVLDDPYWTWMMACREVQIGDVDRGPKFMPVQSNP